MGRDNLDTLWEYAEHTRAKHEILRAYLDAWFPILGSIKRAERVLFVDGFAGPGRYSGGEEGSPAIAIRSACEHTASFKVPVRLVFIEENAARYRHLKTVVEALRPLVSSAQNIVDVREPRHGDCAEELDKALSSYESLGRPFGPALVFLDQFGYSDVPMSLVKRIMAQSRCETFTYMHAEGMTRFLSQENVHDSVTRAFGSDGWKKALSVPQEQRARVLAADYEQALRSRAGAKFVWRFAMHGAGDRLLYWLFFATNSLEGLKVMKRSMRTVDTSGGYFSFSDARSPDQILLFERCGPEWLREHLEHHFAGQTMSVEAVEEHVLTATPLVSCKKVLGSLETAGRLSPIRPPKGRRKRSFKDSKMLLRFEPIEPAKDGGTNRRGSREPE